MSFATSEALQTALFQVLVDNAALTGLVGDAIYDEVPPGPVPGTWISIGAGEVRDLSDATAGLGDHRIDVAVVSDAEGFAEAKRVGAAVTDALVGSTPALTRGRVVTITFLKSRARRVRAGQLRRIDLTFRALVDDN